MRLVTEIVGYPPPAAWGQSSDHTTPAPSLISPERRHKIAIVVGHNKDDKGAYCPAPIAAAEYDFNGTIADRMIEMALPEFELRKFLRRPIGYRAEIADVYRQVDDWGAEASVELHFNAATADATGTEVLVSSSMASQTFGKAMLEIMLMHLGLRSRGVKVLGHGDRGLASVTSGRCPSILCEPFFSSNPADVRKAFALGINGFASMYLAGIYSFMRAKP